MYVLDPTIYVVNVTNNFSVTTKSFNYNGIDFQNYDLQYSKTTDELLVVMAYIYEPTNWTITAFNWMNGTAAHVQRPSYTFDVIYLEFNPHN